MADLTRFKVLRGHEGDRVYLEGDERIVEKSMVKHLIPHVLEEIGAAKNEPAPKNKAEGAAPKNKSDGPADVAAVLALADGNFIKFKAAAKLHLGDATPAKKDEILAALKAIGSGETKKPADMTDDELKALLAAKGVTIGAETREELVALAEAANE